MHGDRLPLSEATQPLFAGVDIGGTNMKLGIVDSQGRTLAFHSIPTEQHNGAEAAAKRVSETLAQLCTEIGTQLSDIKRVGLASPGPMDIPNGMLLDPGNLPEWHNTPLRDLFAKATRLPVTYANDANAAAYGEFWSGAGERFDDMVFIALGTGVGGGIIINDEIIEGSHSCGGEIGHIIIDASPDAPLNSLGIRGTLEGYCGSYGVVGRAKSALADKYVESSLRDSIADVEELTPLLVANAAEAGDKLALKVVMDTARYLAIGIVTCVHTLDPQGVVIGGGMTFGGAGHPLGEKFLAEVQLQTKERLIKSLREKVVIEFAQLGGVAGYIGAAGLARRDSER